jgi:hypothetical protein
MGETCGTYEGRRISHTKFWWEKVTEINHYQDLDVDGKTDLKEKRLSGIRLE